MLLLALAEGTLSCAILLLTLHKTRLVLEKDNKYCGSRCFYYQVCTYWVASRLATAARGLLGRRCFGMGVSTSADHLVVSKETYRCAETWDPARHPDPPSPPSSLEQARHHSIYH